MLVHIFTKKSVSELVSETRGVFSVDFHRGHQGGKEVPTSAIRNITLILTFIGVMRVVIPRVPHLVPHRRHLHERLYRIHNGGGRYESIHDPPLSLAKTHFDSVTSPP